VVWTCRTCLGWHLRDSGVGGECLSAVWARQRSPGSRGGRVHSAGVRRAEAARKLDLAESILSQRETEASRPFDARYRGFLKADLAALTDSQLESLQGAGPLVNLREALIPNTLGDTSADLVYTPVVPCRVFDTRSASAGILVGGTQRNFVVAGTTGFAAQGGNSVGCGVPLGRATSVIINFASGPSQSSESRDTCCHYPLFPWKTSGNAFAGA
jgi:hypothetical protein